MEFEDNQQVQFNEVDNSITNQNELHFSNNFNDNSVITDQDIDVAEHEHEIVEN